MARSAALKIGPEEHAAMCRMRLRYYARLAWQVVEPRAEFIPNWHIDVICEYLQAVTRLEIRNLIINIPPRHMKSLLVSVMWPTWSWIDQPHLRWLTGSYAAPLAVRDALKSRRILQSAWYRSLFGEPFHLCGDQNARHRYENDRGGFRLAYSFGGAVTGEGGDILVVDDPLKAQDAASESMRGAVNETYDQALSTRANDPRSARRVIIMQRLHEDDLTGHLLERMGEPGADQYVHLCLPTEYEPKRFFPPPGLPGDSRQRPGELLWPQRFGPAENLAARAALGERGYACQHSQRPAPAGGSIFRADWWQGRNRFDPDEEHLPAQVAGRWLSWDTAFKDREENDASALCVLELTTQYRLLLRHAWWGRLEFPQLASTVLEEARRWDYDGKLRGIIIEDKASGTSALQTLGQSAPPETAGLLIPFSPGQRSKAGRARQASLWCERGCVLLPHPAESVPWLMEFERMLWLFPSAKLNDPADSFTQGILFLENLLAEGWRER